MDTAPALRPELTIAPSPEGSRLPFVVDDPLFDRRIYLDQATADIAQAMGEPQGLGDLATASGQDEEATRRIVDRLVGLHLAESEVVDGWRADAREMDALLEAPAAEVPLLIREDSRFSCTMCGSCCSSQNLGPVLEDKVEALRPHFPMLKEATGALNDLFFRVKREDQAIVDQHVLCHVQDGACVFLGEDRKCTIHSKLGGEAKPRICQLFPYRFVATPTGVTVSLQMECRGFAEAHKGKPLTDSIPYLRQLLADSPGMTRMSPVVQLDRDTPLRYRDYEALEDRLHAAVDAHADRPLDALVAMRAVIVDALGGTEPDPRPPVDIAELRRDMDRFAASMMQALQSIRDAVPDDMDGIVIHADGLYRLMDSLLNLRPDFARIALPPDKAEKKAIFVRKMHEELMGKRLAMAPTVVEGFARLALQWMLSQSLAYLRAREVVRRHLVPQDWVDGMVVLSYLFRNQDLQKLFKRAREPIVDLFFGRLPDLVAHANELPDPDTRQQIYKF